MKVLSKGPWVSVNAYGTVRRRELNYRARLYDNGKYLEQDCADTLFEKTDGRLLFLNTSTGVSYYDKLAREACK